MNEFENNGFIIKENLISDELNNEIFLMFYDISYHCLKRNNIRLDYDLIKTEDIDIKCNIKELDKNLLKILSHDKNLIGELYDTVSYSSTFLKLVSDSQIEDISRSLLGLSKYNSIYSWTHRVRIDPPKDNRRTYGWHQEIFYTIPDTKFIQTWCPLIRNTTIENGTIEIKRSSHKEGIADQTWNDIDGRATQILVNENVISKYETTQLPMELGDVLFFDPHLIHRSGQNITKDEIRFSLVGMWNDTTYKGFRAPKPKFESRTFSARENYEKYFS